MVLSKIKSNLRISYHHRHFILMAVFMWIIVACFTIFQYDRERTFKAELLDCKLQSINNQVIERINIGHTPQQIADDIDSVRVTIINLKGEVTFDSYTDTITNNHLGRPEIIKALNTGKGYIHNRHSSSTDINYFYSATLSDEFIVRTAMPYNISLISLLSADMLFLWFMLIVSLIVTVIAYFTTRRLGKNITRLRDFAERAKQGEPINIYQNFTHDELGEISQNIIQLYSTLQQTTMDRDREHQRVLHEQDEKTRIKKLLTNNINHELKTPVTAIIGYLETILNTNNIPHDKVKSFLGSTYKQACRLQSLLHDVSTITRMDESTELVKKEIISFDEIIEEVTAEMDFRTEDKRLRINCNLPQGLEIEGDYSLVSSIFRNLAYNASNYSGGRDIFIHLIKETRSHYTFMFADNGVGVGEEHLDKLFERFYRVDKGRSRKDGGTGLGLAIVKNAILLHGGTITVINRETGGLEFTFSLQKKH